MTASLCLPESAGNGNIGVNNDSSRLKVLHKSELTTSCMDSNSDNESEVWLLVVDLYRPRYCGLWL